MIVIITTVFERPDETPGALAYPGEMQVTVTCAVCVGRVTDRERLAASIMRTIQLEGKIAVEAADK